MPENNRVHPTSISFALLGTLLEYFDHFIYTYLFLVFLPLFFPTDNPLKAAVIRAAAMSLTFIVRPISALFFARMADIKGRRFTLLLTSMITGITTVGIGILPTYEQIGFAASLSFIVLRIMQVLAISGETTTAVFFLYEHAPSDKKALYTSLINVTAMLGAIVASLVCVLSFHVNYDKAWRIVFILGGLTSLAGYFIRKNIKESPVFENIKEQSMDFNKTVKNNSQFIIPHFFAGILNFSITYIMMIYLADFYRKIGFSDQEIILRNACFCGVTLFCLVASAYMSDRIGHNKVLRGGAIFLFGASTYLFSLLDGNVDEKRIFLVHTWLALTLGLVGSCTPAATIQLWPPRIALQIGALIWGLASFFSAGGMPLLIATSYEISSSYLMGIYMKCICAIVFFTWHPLFLKKG